MAMSTLHIAERFVALGGRLIVDPKGGLSFALSADRVLTMTLTIRQRASAFRIKRAARVLAWRQTEEIAALVTERGTLLPGGWIIWEGR